MQQLEAGRVIKTEQDVGQIKHSSERRFALFLIRHNPNISLVYEPRQFVLEEDGAISSTIPDFEVVNARGDHNGRKTFLEITLASKNGYDPKEGQKRIMSMAAPQDRYIVLYQENLGKIQRAHPEFDPYR